MKKQLVNISKYVLTRVLQLKDGNSKTTET